MELLTIRDVSERLSVDWKTAKRWMEAGELPPPSGLAVWRDPKSGRLYAYEKDAPRAQEV